MKCLNKRFMASILILSMLLSMAPSKAFAENSVLYGDVNDSGNINQEDVDDL